MLSTDLAANSNDDRVSSHTAEDFEIGGGLEAQVSIRKTQKSAVADIDAEIAIRLRELEEIFSQVCHLF